MNNHINTFLSFYQNRKNIILYNAWVDNNAPYYMRYYTLLALAITSLLIPFDFLLYESPFIYTYARAILMTIYIFQIIIIFSFFKVSQQQIFYPMILIPPLSYNLTYSYFLFKSNPLESYYPILLLATFFVIIISNLFLYKFYKEQYCLTLISVATLFFVSIYKPEISSDIVKLIVFHITSLIICIYYRYAFMDSIVNNYEYLSSLVPRKFAKLVSVSDENLDIEKLFPTKEYFSPQVNFSV